jgi:hypothetical protein
MAEPAAPPPDAAATVAALDDEWAATRESLMVRGKGGAPTEPSLLRAVTVTAVGVGAGAFAYLTAMNSGLPAVVVWGLPVAFGLIGVWSGFTVLTAARRWAVAERDYRRRRDELVSPAPGRG